MEPCDSCINKYGIDDLNSVNNCCFEKCADETGMDNVWDIVPTPCGRNCMACLNKAKLARGRSLCYQRRIGPPPIFVENYEGGDSYQPYAQEHPFVFYISFGIGAIILALVLTIVVLVIFGGDRRRRR